MLIKEIVLLTSADSETLKNFYTGLLGLEVLKSGKLTISFSAGDSILTFEKKSKYIDPFYHFAFNIPANKFQEAKEFLTSSGIELLTLDGNNEFDFKSWNAHSVYFYDPAGNILEFISRHNLKNKSEQKFSGNSILNISEIGFPVKNVNEFYLEIQKKLGIPFFSGDKKSFTAMGDDNGLFIIVTTGRIWFPDCGPAMEYPMRVILSSDPLKDFKYKYSEFQIISEK